MPALIERLTLGARKSSREIMFLVGSPLSAPLGQDDSGVLGVDAIIKLIREEFNYSAEMLAEFDRDVAHTSGNSYQAAFTFLLGRRSQQVANDIIKRAVWRARKPIFAESGSATYVPSESTTDDACRTLDSDYMGWMLTPGLETLGALIAGYPDHFGKAILTTNFDPLIEVAIKRAGGASFRTVLHRDGNLAQTEGDGCHVIHLHGYWHGSDTLHTPRQLTQPRPRLKASLASFLRGKTVVVSGYGGWDDTFMEALMEVVLDDHARPEILWTFKSDTPCSTVTDRLAPGLDRGRVMLYSGVDCHELFPRLLRAWQVIQPPVCVPLAHFEPIRIPVIVPDQTSTDDGPSPPEKPARIVEGDDEDRPPLVEVCVGRQQEFERLVAATAPVVFLTGIGGQGKSTLAAQYFSDSQKGGAYDLFVWRDCKEEGERFENQLISIFEKLTLGKISGSELEKRDVKALVELILTAAGSKRLLFVFDNVDHYVNLEENRLSSGAHEFLQAFLASASKSQAVFTCRPSLRYDDSRILHQRLEGLNLAATIQLFTQRRASSSATEIEEAHELTEGHAFWLDLLAIQVAKQAGVRTTLGRLIAEIRSGGGQLPEATLQSIWDTLQDREKLVLRTMAETVRPETEAQIGRYLASKLNYNRVVKALRALRGLNLIVVKPRSGDADALELHPLVREFVRRNFRHQDRLTFIDAIIDVYLKFMGLHKSQLDERPSFAVLQAWTQNAELAVAAGKYQEAFTWLAEASDAFSSSAFPGEYARAANLLFSHLPDWPTRYSEFKDFEDVFHAYVDVLANLGRAAEADSLLDDYAITVSNKDARYINYCDLRCHANWVRGNYEAAIKWGTRGQGIRTKSGVDTKYDTSHNLALAQRDSGDVDPALKTFLTGRSLSEVIDPDELDEERGGHYYGNIGRCLHLMGQIDPAIVCYRKSAILIEKKYAHQHVLNQGFIRRWIGELLIMREEHCLAKIFLEACALKWQSVAPSRAMQIVEVLDKIKDRASSCKSIKQGDLERVCTAWIYGREYDVELSAEFPVKS